MSNSAEINEFLALERRFWDAMRDKDGNAAGALTAVGSIVVGAQGVSVVEPEAMTRMTKEGKWTLKSYDFDPKSIKVQKLGEDIAIVAYTVIEDLEMEGKPVTRTANDSSVWVRHDGRWGCALHTESLAGGK